jgi:hypothetical protein
MIEARLSAPAALQKRRGRHAELSRQIPEQRIRHGLARTQAEAGVAQEAELDRASEDAVAPRPGAGMARRDLLTDGERQLVFGVSERADELIRHYTRSAVDLDLIARRYTDRNRSIILKKALAERALNAAMDQHLAREETGITGNGYGRKTAVADTGNRLHSRALLRAPYNNSLMSRSSQLPITYAGAGRRSSCEVTTPQG